MGKEFHNSPRIYIAAPTTDPPLLKYADGGVLAEGHSAISWSLPPPWDRQQSSKTELL